MQFSNIVLRIAEETGLSATGDATKIKSWVNESYRFLAGMREWSWMFTPGIIQTTPDITTLTASVVSGGTTVTLSSTYASSLATDYWIQFSATDDWYNITAHTAGTDELTIDPGYAPSAALVAGTCTIRRKYYSLATDADRIIDMYQAVTDQKLVYVDPREMDRVLADPTANSSPNSYTLLGFDSAGSWRARFYPISDDTMNIHYNYYKRITDLSADADLPVLPAKWHQAIIFVALSMFGHAYIDDSRMENAVARARQVVSEMLKQQSPLPDNHKVIKTWDSRGGSHYPGAQFPPDFPRYRR